MIKFLNYKFIKPDPSLKNNLMAFGFEIGDGWMPLMEELCEKIQSIINKDPEKYNNFEFTQVKEKWGRMTIYCNIWHEEIELLIEEYGDKSETTCELCGSSGAPTKISGWIKTLCASCRDKAKI